MKDSILSFIGILLIVAVSAIIGCEYGRKTARKPVDLHVVWDTTEVTVYKEKIVEKPVPKYIYKDRIDTMWLPTPQGDSSLVNVPIERKVYEEDSLYRAVVSGFHPSLDSLIVWPKTTTITITKPEFFYGKAPRWSIGITAGPSILATPNGNVHAGLGITAGVSYRF